jgi:pimeloyl-ACP methyl ester carboxylesterase
MLVVVGAVLLALLVALAGYHQVMLPLEAGQLRAPGTLVEVDGRTIHVVIEGRAQAARPPVVMLAGAATIAPAYDFRVLSRLLAADHQTVIVEKLGYGYSDIADTDRGIEALVADTRRALHEAGIEPPYVLAAHSMSGLEVLWWAEHYPREVGGIIGLDMSTPEAYVGQDEGGIAAFALVGQIASWLGLQRIPGLYPGLSDAGLTEPERRQQELLLYRNAGNVSHIRESGQVLGNAELVGLGSTPDVPVLLFSSDGRDLAAGWTQAQRDLADRAGARLVMLDCGHSIHHCAPERIARESAAFLESFD